MDIRFDGKRALVTGAGKGIGRGITVKLAELGADVVAISRTQADLDSLEKEVPGIVTYNVDLSDWDATRKVVEGVGDVDLLINNAGVTNWTPFLDVTRDELENLFAINYKAVYNVSQIRVNSVNPTVVLTELGKKGWGTSDKVAEFVAKTPLGRLADVEHIVDATLFLLSERSSMTSGIVMPVDGGITSCI